MLKHLYPKKDEWNLCVFAPLVSLVERYKDDIVLKHIGFPDDWINQLHN